MPVIAAHEIDIKSGSTPIYNGLDCCLTFEIDQVRQNLRRNDTLIYDFERAMQGPCLEMMQRGFLVDMNEREKSIISVGKKKEDNQRFLSHIIEAIKGSYDSKFANSPKQLQSLFYDIMKLKPIERHTDGETKRPMNRETLERLELADKWVSPIIHSILFHRDLSKTLQVLETEIDSDWRWRCSYNIGGTSTGRWCLSPETEVLTLNGWRAISSISDTETIAVWNQNRWKRQSIRFESCSRVKFPNNERLTVVENDRFYQETTGEHRLPYLTTKGNLNISLVKERKRLHAVPICGNLDADKFEPEEVTRVIVMTQADGTVVHDNLIRFHFSKPRKIERCRKNLISSGIDFKETLSKADDTTYIYVYNPPEWMKESKQFDSYLLQHNPRVFIDEISEWDGYIDHRNGGCEYSTTNKENAEWAQTMAHLAGCCATIKHRERQSEGWSDSYRVWIGSTTNTRVKEEHYRTSNYIPDEVYCMETSTGFFMVRNNGLISVTGNSSSKSPFGSGNNFQNINEELRRIFIPDPGFKLYGIDKAQSEARDVGWFCGTILGDWTYLDACESGDLHTYVTRLCYPEWDWTGDLKKDRAIAERRFYRFFTYRDVSKRVGHATNYGGRPSEISKQTRLPLEIAIQFQDRYFAAFPCIQRMHTYIANKLQTDRFLVNSFGRRRDFFDRPDSNDTIKGAIAFMFQSATGDCLNLGLYRLWKEMGTRIQILSQLHDAVYFQYPIVANDNEEKEMLIDAMRLLEVRQRDPKTGRTMTIPGEAVGGFNWAHRFRLREDGSLDDWNPRGLDKVRMT